MLKIRAANCKGIWLFMCNEVGLLAVMGWGYTLGWVFQFVEWLTSLLHGMVLES